jgi:hypothetical protein
MQIRREMLRHTTTRISTVKLKTCTSFSNLFYFFVVAQKNKFEKLVHLCGFTIEIYHNARLYKRQNTGVFLNGVRKKEVNTIPFQNNTLLDGRSDFLTLIVSYAVLFRTGCMLLSTRQRMQTTETVADVIFFCVGSTRIVKLLFNSRNASPTVSAQ